jgi:hypothetical protein
MEQQHDCDPQPRPPQPTIPSGAFTCPVCGDTWYVSDVKDHAEFPDTPGLPATLYVTWNWNRGDPKERANR